MRNALCIVAAGILWGIISIFVSQLSAAGFTSMQVVAIRVLFAAVALVAALLVFDRSRLRVRLRDLPLFVGTGLCSIVFFNYCYFEAITEVGGSAIPALMLYTAPVFVMALSLPLFKEPLTARKVMALALTLLGLALVTGALAGGGTLSVRAVLLGLGSGLGYALYSIFGKFLVGKYSAVTITTYTFVMAALFAVPISGLPTVLGNLSSGQAVASALGISLICTVAPFLLYTRGLQGMEAGKASILATVEPLVAAVVGVVYFHEVFTANKVAGIAIVLLAVVILNLPGMPGREGGARERDAGDAGGRAR